MPMDERVDVGSIRRIESLPENDLNRLTERRRRSMGSFKKEEEDRESVPDHQTKEEKIGVCRQ